MLDEYPYSYYFDEISEVFIVMDDCENIDKCETHEEAENFVAGLNIGYAKGKSAATSAKQRVKLAALQAAGDGLAEEVTDAIDTIRTAVRLMTTADGMKLLNDKIDKLNAKLTAWEQAKEMT